jgi:NADH-quinone oxidoreductase subunit G
LAEQLDRALRGAGRLAAVLSPHLTVEEAYLLAKYARRVDPQALLVAGPVPRVGQDESFPGGFVIRAEKGPNRRGVEAIVAALGRGLLSWEEFLAGPLPSGDIAAAWISGGYPTVWHDEETAAKFADLRELVVQDLFPSPLWQRATFQLPGAAFAEREGSYVNFADRLQSFSWAVRPPAGVMVEGRLYWRLLGETGLYAAAPVLAEVAAETLYFAAATQPPPDVGLDLKVNLLA